MTSTPNDFGVLVQLYGKLYNFKMDKCKKCQVRGTTFNGI